MPKRLFPACLSRQGAIDIREAPADIRQGDSDIRQEGGDLREGPADIQKDDADLREARGDIEKDAGDIQKAGGQAQKDHGDSRKGLGDRQKARTRRHAHSSGGVSPPSAIRAVGAKGAGRSLYFSGCHVYENKSPH